jgi:16S rRNA (guanine527-N7)-methyltransferase
VSLLEFRRIVRTNGLAVSEEQFALLERYVGLLLDWNGKINLISRRDQENVWFAHMVHSASPWFFVDIAPGLRVLDLGTGGGLPGIPLAILRPDLKLTLLDSIRKKVEAVGQMASELGLANVDTVVGRAEEIGREARHRHLYDVVVARAVARLSDLTKWSRPFLKERRGSRPSPSVSMQVRGARTRIDGPCLLTLKGGDLEGEVREAGLGGARVQVVPLVFPGCEEIGLEEKKLLIVHVR